MAEVLVKPETIDHKQIHSIMKGPRPKIFKTINIKRKLQKDPEDKLPHEQANSSTTKVE